MTGQLLAFIAGKMTPVLQLTDVAVAFLFKKFLEAVKNEERRKKRGDANFEAAFLEVGPEETACGAGDLMRILGLSWRRLIQHDEVDHPDRLLKAARSIGWLSYRADPARKVLIRCDGGAWMSGRANEFPVVGGAICLDK